MGTAHLALPTLVSRMTGRRIPPAPPLPEFGPETAMVRHTFPLAAGLLAAAWTLAGMQPAFAEERIVEKDGKKMREIREVVRQPLMQTQLEPRERTVMQDRYTTEMKSMERSYQVPVTTYQWTPQWEYSWNPLAAPQMVYRQVPVTRWETRKETVRVPVTRHESVPTKIVEHVPVTRQSVVEREYITRVEVPPTVTAPTTDPFQQTLPAASVATRPSMGGILKLDGAPPRDGSGGWRAATPKLTR
jgi:hypothetical protein